MAPCISLRGLEIPPRREDEDEEAIGWCGNNLNLSCMDGW
jgi:hypothetical protein